MWQVRFLPSLLFSYFNYDIEMNAKETKKKLRQLPGVDVVIEDDKVKKMLLSYGRELVIHMIREEVSESRNKIIQGGPVPDIEHIVARVEETVKIISSPSLKRVINATGIVIHTNLGRAPLGEKAFEDLKEIILGYSNLEFNLKKGTRGRRSEHVVSLLKFITGAEDAVVVNNNAAGIILVLNTLANGKEVIISRGELIEIGGSFRIPEIMAASGAKMVEVGTTNKTHLTDYDKAINENTALILKVHKSNYEIQGFSDEVSLKDLVDMAHSKDLPVLYDIGSGLLRKLKNLPLDKEPDVRTSIEQGADLVSFSGDKLLGGPQAGIVAGKKELISLLSKVPMMRAMRVGKLTLAALSSVIRSYFNDEALKDSLPIFSMLERTEEELRKNAEILLNELMNAGLRAKIVKSNGQCGGGALPTQQLKSYAVALVSERRSRKDRALFAEKMFHKLLELDYPVIGILRKGEILFDVLTLSEADFPIVVSAISEVFSSRI